MNMDNHDLHYFCMPLGGGCHAYSAMNMHDEWQELKNGLVKQFANRYKFTTVYFIECQLLGGSFVVCCQIHYLVVYSTESCCMRIITK